MMVVEVQECGDDRGSWDITPNQQFLREKEKQVTDSVPKIWKGGKGGQQRGVQSGGIGAENGHLNYRSQSISIFVDLFPDGPC